MQQSNSNFPEGTSNVCGDYEMHTLIQSNTQVGNTHYVHVAQGYRVNNMVFGWAGHRTAKPVTAEQSTKLHSLTAKRHSLLTLLQLILAIDTT